MAKSRNTIQKTQREMEKKRKAQEKRVDKQKKKDVPPGTSAPERTTGYDYSSADE